MEFFIAFLACLYSALIIGYIYGRKQQHYNNYEIEYMMYRD